MRFLNRTPVRTFIPYPLIALAWEWVLRGGSLVLHYWFLPMMLWGLSPISALRSLSHQTRGGGPGLETPPEWRVSVGPYAYTRNPMYLGHL